MGCGLTCADDRNNNENVVGRMSFLEQSMCCNNLYPTETEHPATGWIINVAFRMTCAPLAEPPMDMIKSTFLHILLPCERINAVATRNGTWRAAMLDTSYHFVEDQLPDGGMSQLMNGLEKLIERDLDKSYPLWRVHVLSSRGPSGETCILVVLRVHHCISDGMHLVRALGPLTKRILDKQHATSNSNDIVTRARKAMHEHSGGILLAPYYVSSFVSNLVFNFRQLETDTPFNKPLSEREVGRHFGGSRRIITLPRHSLAFVKAIKHSTNVSLLAVLLSVFTGALRRYSAAVDPEFLDMIKRKSDEQDFFCRASIPSLVLPSDPDEDSNTLGNSFSVVSCDLALATPGPLDRLIATDSALQNVKPPLMAEVTAWQEANLLANLPLAQRQWEVLRFISMHSIDFSSVPGPEEPIWIAEQEVQDIIVGLPNMLPQIIAVSCAGVVHPTFTVESSLISNPDLLSDSYMAELTHLGEACRIRGDPIFSKSLEECLPLDMPRKVVEETSDYDDMKFVAFGDETFAF